MAVTCQDIVTASYRDAGMIMDDEQPEAEQASRGLSHLQRLYKALFTGGTFGRTLPRLITDDYTGEEGAAVTVESGTPTVSYPATIASNIDPLPYGQESAQTFPSGVNSNSRAPRDLTIVEKASSTAPSLKVYDAQAASWVELLGLSLDDDAPLAGRWEDELTAMLTERIARSPVATDIKIAAAKARLKFGMNAPAAYTPTQAEFF